MHPSVEQARYLEEIDRRRRDALDRMLRLPVAALIWGSNPTAATSASETRLALRDELIRLGYVAQFSEDLYDPTSPLSLPAQQVAHVEAHDIVFSIPDGHGSVAEIHDFAKLPLIGQKIVTFLNTDHAAGYSSLGLIQQESIVTASIQLYNPVDLPGCIISKAIEIMRRIQEVQYMMGRRC